MNNTLTALIMIFTMAFSTLKAQQETIKLWPDGVPGAIENSSYTEEAVEGKDGITRVFRTKDPELIVFPAPKDIATGTAIIICPGGGYHITAIDHERTKVAQWLNKIGITAFVLKYRLPSDKIMENKSIGPLQDAQSAMRIVRQDAKKWNIKADRIGIMGFSAGGRLASTLSTHYLENVYPVKTKVIAKPDFSILLYPVISMDPQVTHMGSRTYLLGKNPTKELEQHFSNELTVDKETPMAFIALAGDDKAVPVMNSISYFLALKKYDIPAEMHIYEKGGHGFGLKKIDSTTSFWTEDCEHWLRMHKLIKQS